MVGIFIMEKLGGINQFGQLHHMTFSAAPRFQIEEELPAEIFFSKKTIRYGHSPERDEGIYRRFTYKTTG
jgi:hypothetical protein